MIKWVTAAESATTMTRHKKTLQQRSATIDFLLTTLIISALAQTTIGLRSIEVNSGEGRKLFGGYRITPKHCRATKTLPNGDPRSNGPTICMFNHECAQRNGEVVGACMDGFLFGACCQVPNSHEFESTLIKDAQNAYYQQHQQQKLQLQQQSNPAAAQSYETYGENAQQQQKPSSNYNSQQQDEIYEQQNMDKVYQQLDSSSTTSVNHNYQQLSSTTSVSTNSYQAQAQEQQQLDPANEDQKQSQQSSNEPPSASQQFETANGSTEGANSGSNELEIEANLNTAEASTNAISDNQPPSIHVHKHSVTISSPSSSPQNDDFVMQVLSTLPPEHLNDHIMFTTEVPMKIASVLIEHSSSESNSFEEAPVTQMPPQIVDNPRAPAKAKPTKGAVKKPTKQTSQTPLTQQKQEANQHKQQQQQANQHENQQQHQTHQQQKPHNPYNHNHLMLADTEFTHSTITHPGAEAEILEDDLQFSTGYGPQPVYLESPTQNQASSNNYGSSTTIRTPAPEDKYELVQTITNDQNRPSSSPTTSSSITTHDSIESIILQLNNTQHGPTYNVVSQQTPIYGSDTTNTLNQPSHGYFESTTARPSSYQEIETKRPVDLNEQNESQKYPAYLEPVTTNLQSQSQVIYDAVIDDSKNEDASSYMQNGYPSPKPISIENNNAGPTYTDDSDGVLDEHIAPDQNYNDASNSDHQTSEFNKMPAVGIAYPVDMSYIDEDGNIALSNEEQSVYIGPPQPARKPQAPPQPQGYGESTSTTAADNRPIPSYIGMVTSQNYNNNKNQPQPPVYNDIHQVPDEVMVSSYTTKVQEDYHSPSSYQTPLPELLTTSNYVESPTTAPIPTTVRPPSTPQYTSSTSTPLALRPDYGSGSSPFSSTSRPSLVTAKPKPRPKPNQNKRTTKRPSNTNNKKTTKPQGSKKPAQPANSYNQSPQSTNNNNNRTPQPTSAYNQEVQPTNSYNKPSNNHNQHQQPQHEYEQNPTTQQPGSHYNQGNHYTKQPSNSYNQADHTKQPSKTYNQADHTKQPSNSYNQADHTKHPSNFFNQVDHTKQPPNAYNQADHTKHPPSTYNFTDHTQPSNNFNQAGDTKQPSNTYNQADHTKLPSNTYIQADYSQQPLNNYQQTDYTKQPTNGFQQADYTKQPTSAYNQPEKQRPQSAPAYNSPTNNYNTEPPKTNQVTHTYAPPQASAASYSPEVNPMPSLSYNAENVASAPTQRPLNRKPDIKRPANKPISTSYVTGPTSPRPPTTFIYHDDEVPPLIVADNKLDSFVQSTAQAVAGGATLPNDETYQSPAYVNAVTPVHIQRPENIYNTHKKPGFVKVQSTIRPPAPTVLITPKPTVINLVTSTSWTQKPGGGHEQQNYDSGYSPTTPIPGYGSTSYIYSPLVTRRPDFGAQTQEYVSMAPVTSNEFDDPGYYGGNGQTVVHQAFTQATTEATYAVPSDGRPAFPGYYGPTPTYPTFSIPGEKLGGAIEEETFTSPNDFVNFPPVRNPNLNMSATQSAVTSDLDLSTPAFVEDIVLKDKMNTLVHKIVESLQGNFDALADMIDGTNNSAAISSFQVENGEQTSYGTTSGTRKPTRKPTRVTATTTRPKATTKKPISRVTTKRSTVSTRIPATRRPATTSRKPPTRKPTRRVSTSTTQQAIVQEIVDEEDEEDINPSDNEVDQSDDEISSRKIQCGVRPQVKSGRIVGGKGSTFGAFPWQVLVRESTWLGLFTKNKCGGVLITNHYVITAAHCQPGFLASLVAVLGEFDISSDLENKKPVTKNVKRVIVHRQYDPATFENDLALLELDSPVTYDTHIVPICMPSDYADFTGRMATVTGWGRLKYGGGVPSVLQEVQVPIIENSVCQEMFHTAGHNKKILSSFLCAGYANGQKDSCEGDSGGPLVLQRPDGRYELAGTVSHGIKCAAPYLPGVYMRTTYYKPWLRSITGVK